MHAHSLTATYENLVRSWNHTLDVLADIAEVPVALVMQVAQPHIKVFAHNHHPDNPYHIDDKEILDGSGLYCEHVIKTQKTLLVANALKDKDWDQNPDIKLGMISYLGMPIVDAINQPFGTLCILDQQENPYNEKTIRLLETIRQSFETQLSQIYLQHKSDIQHGYAELLYLTSGIAHEVNTPLGGAITASSCIDTEINKLKQALVAGKFSKHKLEECLATLEESATLLLTCLRSAADKIDSIQALAKEEADLIWRSEDLASVINDVKVNLKPLLQKNGIAFKLDPETKRSITLSTNRRLLMQVLDTLCKNSLVHAFIQTQSPQIRVAIRCKGELVIIDYFDNGKGIPAEIHEQVFMPYFGTNKIQGRAGLGLAIIKRIVSQQLDGEIFLLPSKRGVHFQICLPRITRQDLN